MATRRDVARLIGARYPRSAQLRLAGQRVPRAEVIDELVRLFADPGGPRPPRRASEGEAMGLPPFGRAVALIANALASTPWYARRKGPAGVWETLPDQPAVLVDPDPLATPWHYRWAVAEDGVLWGNHFALFGDLDWRTGRPGWLVPVAPTDVWVLSDPARPGWYGWAIGGVEFAADDLLHVPFGAGSGRLLGRGVIEQYGYWLSGAVAAEEYSRDTFEAGALPPAVLTSRNVGNQGDADVLKAKWRQLTSLREPVVLPEGTELKPVVGNAQQQQLVEARTWNAQMVADLVGVPGWKLGLDGPTMTYQNVQDADVDFVRDSVDRYAQPVNAAFSKWLMPGGTEVFWDYAARMRPDQKATAEVLTTYTGAGILTVDEARAAIDRPPLATPPAPPDTDPDIPTGDPGQQPGDEIDPPAGGVVVPSISGPIAGGA